MDFGGSYIITGSPVEGIGNEWTVSRFLNFRINMMFCDAGFRPGRRGFAWRVPKGATFVVEQKVPKPLTPRLAS